MYVNGSKQIVTTNYTETDSNTVTFLTGLNVGDLVQFSTATPVAPNATTAANVSYTPAGITAIPTTVQTKLRESVSVMDFGATGNGTTDDTAAIQAAITAIENNMVLNTVTSPALGPQVLYFPDGYYKISAPLVITQAITLMGSKSAEYATGARLFQSVSGDLLRFNPAGGGISFSVERLTLISTVAGTGNLINVLPGTPGYNSWRVKDCCFVNPQQMSIRATGDDIQITDCTFDVSGFSGNSIQLGSNTAGDVASNVRITGCNFFSTIVKCILHYNAYNVVVANNQVSQTISSKTVAFYDAFDSTPTLVKSIAITGNNLVGVSRLLAVNTGSDISFVGNVCNDCGNGVSEIYNAILLSGNINGININANLISGAYGANNIVSSTVTTLTNANITQNIIRATTSGAAIALGAGTVTNTLAWPNVISNATTILSATNTSSVGYILTNNQVVSTTGGTIAPNLALGSSLLLSVTGTSAITISAPLNALDGLTYSVLVVNSSGSAMGTITWATGIGGFKLNAFTNPATGFCQNITFKYSVNLSSWIEISRTSTQIAV